MISCAVRQSSQYSNDFQPYPGAEAYGKILSHDSSGSRNPCSHRCTRELKITVFHSIYVTYVNCHYSSFSVLQKLEEVQVTIVYGYFRN